VSAILGISGGHHDAAAALVVDGQCVVAIQEERLSRVKHDARLPLMAARACLQFAGIPAAALTKVVLHENPYAALEHGLVRSLRRAPMGMRSFPRAMSAQLGGKVWALDALSHALGVDRQRCVHREHHESHAASAFFASPFARAAVLTIDGVGEDTCTAIWEGDGTSLRCIERQPFPHSLGLLYAAITSYLGFEVNGGEYKVMGLAAHGKPMLRDAFDQFVRVLPEGGIELVPRFFDHFDSDVGFGKPLEQLLGQRRAYGLAWDLEHPATMHAANVAATLQAITEEVVIGLAQRARAKTTADVLCMAGGVALNCVANAKLQASHIFKDVFVQPASGDAGTALGAAWMQAISDGAPRQQGWSHARWGLPANIDDALALSTSLGLHHARVNDPASALADKLMRGQVWGLVQGRFEWGPRALGQRSIVAAPKDGDTRERVNRAIKHREVFRPFAPAVLSHHLPKLFDGTPNHLSRFMLGVQQVPPSERPHLAAVTHVDGSSRVQSVDDGEPLAPLLHAMQQHTGMPVVLNTSLNGGGEPMVGSAVDALGFLLSHSVDGVMIEDVMFTKRPT
jgi:carbamoyltransferase